LIPLQLEMFPEWVTGQRPDTSGAYAYVIMIMASEDPKRSPRKKGSDKTPHQTLRKDDPESWRAGFMRILGDGKPRTFNALCIMLADLNASICGGEMPEEVLWQLVEAGAVEYTMHAPVMFRARKQQHASGSARP
jgi:hypothetical protein